MRKITSLLIAVSISGTAIAAGNHAPAPSKYAGQETRAIKSLSAADMEELQRGGGWGLAKAAELNGVPGPAHLVELKHEIHLSHEQVTQITSIFNAMNGKAKQLGQQLIDLETMLEKHFQERTITDEILRDLLKQLADTRYELRYTHLATHLQTPAILSEAQISHYNQLRGYDKPDLCDFVPEGHDPDMWRLHNGCE